MIARALAALRVLHRRLGGHDRPEAGEHPGRGPGTAWPDPQDALCGLPFTPRYWDVVAGGYDPTR